MTNTSQTEKHEKENWRTNTNTAMRPRFKKPKRNKIIEKRKSERKKTPILKNIEKQFQCSWTSVVTHYQLLKLSQSENIKKIMCLFEKTHSKSKKKNNKNITIIWSVRWSNFQLNQRKHLQDQLSHSWFLLRYQPSSSLPKLKQQQQQKQKQKQNICIYIQRFRRKLQEQQ